MPDDLHRTLKARAAMAGMSLSDYVLKALRKEARTPSLEELQARMAARSPTNFTIDPVELIRQERDLR